jgi:hypothetical protein
MLKVAITKSEAVPRSLAIVCAYVLFYQVVHISLFGAPHPFDFWTKAFLIGAFLRLSYYIPARTQAELTFNGKATDTWWNDGFCLVPNVGHMTFSLTGSDFGILWGLRFPDESKAQQDGKINAEVFADQRLPRYNATAQMTPFQMNLDRLMNLSVLWIFGRKHHRLMRIGIAIMLISLIGSIAFHGTRYGTEKLEQGIRTAVGQKSGPASSERGVLVQLRTTTPAMPDDSWFSPGNQDSFMYHGRRYVRYQDDGTEFPVMRLKKMDCVIIPAGKNVWLVTEGPPTDAFNMELARIRPAPALLPETRWEKISWPILGKPDRVEVSWIFARKHWHTANASWGIKTKAMDPTTIPYPNLGGLACF